MAVNIEVKAALADWDSAWRTAQRLSGSPGQKLDQTDTFFHCPAGRLKLRRLGENRGELILYERPDEEGPKTSHYRIARTEDPDALLEILSGVLETKGTVAKTRWVFLAGQTRIHLDRVQSLGEFLELEVVLYPGQPEEEGRAIAAALLREFAVSPASLICGSYFDLLRKPQAGSQGTARRSKRSRKIRRRGA